MKICFFVSIGDDISILHYISQNHNNYDIIANYYGNNTAIFDKIKNLSVYAENHQFCKFPSLKTLYNNYSEMKNYDYIFIYDDDANIVKGSLNDLLEISQKYNLDIVSSSHDPKGKITWNIHLPIKGNHIFRYVNFIEINFPIFSKKGLDQFINEYDSVLCDYGIDHWYSKILKPEHNFNMGIVDSVIIHNPKNSIKLNSKFSPKERNKQMQYFIKKYNIPLIKPKNLRFQLP